MKCLVPIVALLLIAGLPAHAVERTCRDWCTKFMECFSQALKAEGDELPRGKRDEAVDRCTVQCDRMRIPGSVLSCATALACKDVLESEDGGKALKRCEPKGAPAITKALELESRTGDRCTDWCRHYRLCRLRANAAPEFEKTWRDLTECLDGCPDPDSSHSYPPEVLECMTSLSCGDLVGGERGGFSARVSTVCSEQAIAGRGTARGPASPPQPAPGAASGATPGSATTSAPAAGSGSTPGSAGARGEASGASSGPAGSARISGSCAGAVTPGPASAPAPAAAGGASGGSPAVQEAPAGKTCDDMCGRTVDCARMADSSIDPRAMKRFAADCLARCRAGGKTQGEIDCIAAMKCWKGMSGEEIQAAIHRCDGARAAVTSAPAVAGSAPE